jgi:hypothetical protein
MRTPLDTRPCRSFAEAFFERAKRRLEEAGYEGRIDRAYFMANGNAAGGPAGGPSNRAMRS